MNLVTLKQHLTKQKLAPFYIFTGEERRIMNIFLDNMSKISGLPIKKLDTVSAYYAKLGVKTILQSPALYVIRDDIDYIKQSEPVWHKLIDNVKNGNDIVVFVYNNLDKRTKFYTYFEKFIVEFVKLSNTVLKGYIKKDFGLSESVADYIVSISNQDYNTCVLECHKLQCYMNSENCSLEQAFLDCKEFRVLSSLPSEDTLNRFIEYILAQDSRAFYLIGLLDPKTDPPLKIIAYLYNSFRALFNVVAYESGMSFKKNESGVNFWAVKNVEIFGLRWNIKQVYECMKYLQKIESGIKLGSVFPEKVLQELLIGIYTIVRNYDD